MSLCLYVEPYRCTVIEWAVGDCVKYSCDWRPDLKSDLSPYSDDLDFDLETSTWTEDMAFDLELATLDGLRYFVTLAVNCHLLSVMNIYLHKFKYRKVKVKVKRRIAVCKRSLRSPLRELTHHMGPHTCHPAEAVSYTHLTLPTIYSV